MVKFASNVSGAILLPNSIQVTESISGSVVPLAMFWCLCVFIYKGGGDVSKPVPPSSVFQLCSVMLSPRPLFSTVGKVYLQFAYLFSVDKFR